MIKNTDTNEAIVEKVMLLGACVGAIILALFLGAGQNAPLAGMAALLAVAYFVVRRAKKTRRTAAAATVTTGEKA